MRDFRTSLYQNFITFAKSPAILIVSILPVLLLFTLGSITPVSWILPQIISISIIIISFLSVGIQYNEYRETNFFRTTRQTSVSVFQIVLGTFITVFAISFLISIFLMILAWFFTSAVPLLSQTIDNIRLESLGPYQSLIKGEALFSTFTFSSVNWLLFIYSLVITIIMTSLFAIMIGNIFTSLKTYTLFSMGYLSLYITLGGILVPEYIINGSPILLIASNLLPNFHTNAMLSSSINTGLSFAIEKYTNYLDSVSDFTNNVWNDGDFIPGSFASMPEMPGMDPVDITAINGIFPWLIPAYITVSSIISDVFGITIYYDYFSLAYFALYIGHIADVISNTFGVNIDDFGMEEMKNSIIMIDDSIAAVFKSVNSLPYAFGPTLFAVKVNVIPYFIILLSTPTFIKVVRS